MRRYLICCFPWNRIYSISRWCKAGGRRQKGSSGRARLQSSNTVPAYNFREVVALSSQSILSSTLRGLFHGLDILELNRMRFYVACLKDMESITRSAVGTHCWLWWQERESLWEWHYRTWLSSCRSSLRINIGFVDNPWIYSYKHWAVHRLSVTCDSVVHSASNDGHGES